MSAAPIGEVLAELDRATEKFPTWPTDPLHALAVLGEEFGELTKDVLQLTYEPHKTSAENVRKEAIQTAAMALRFAMSLDRYEYSPCSQHSQATATRSPQSLAEVRYYWLRLNFARLVITTEPTFSVTDNNVKRVEFIDVREHFSACDPVSVDAAIDAAMLRCNRDGAA